MNTVLKSLLTPLLCLCLVGGLLSGCTSSNSSQDTSTEYLSEQTQTESFPVRLEIDPHVSFTDTESITEELGEYLIPVN